MIEIQRYRAEIGLFLHNGKKVRKNTAVSKSCPEPDCKVNTGTSILFLLYLYFIMIICSLIMSMSVEFNGGPGSASVGLVYGGRHLRYLASAMSMTNVKYFYCIIIAYVVKAFASNCYTRQYLAHRMLLCPNSKHARGIGRLTRVSQFLFLWLCALNFLLIAIVNPSLLNPGPIITNKSFSVFFQNVQGLIPFGQLSEKHPILNTTKIHELNLYIYKNSPDIIIYNETWLKKSVLDNEIIPTDQYKIFRLDRTSATHPPDPNNDRRFRSNGGGVLIGIKHELEIVSKAIPIRCKAEILSIEFTDKSGRKTILSTLYRVGTLGPDNHSRIDQHLKAIRRRRNVQEIILIGDLNLPNVNWENFTSSNPVEQLFLDTFGNLSLEQLVTVSTHRKGNILDLILSDKAQHINHLTVDSEHSICSSDHYPILFNLTLNAPRKKPIKRTIYNFKQANWLSLNSDLLSTDWENLLTCNDMETAWHRFKSKFSHLCDIHIPKITIKDEFKPPWYDSEVFALDRKKDRLHARWKRSSSDLHYVKFKACRREFKNLAEKKMEANFEDESNRNNITKKFWSYVKAKSSSHRIPELVNYGDRFRSNRKDQCELFNEYFYDQFSEPSLYNIDIDYSNDYLFDINISPERVCDLLLNLNPNKAQGPDGIHGRILKNCARSLGLPLSLLYHKSYCTGDIPADWKLANVVPIHKKGSKVEVSNYRPISLTSLIMKTFERIIRQELLNRCGHLIDQRQHGFTEMKSCCTQLVNFCDSLALSLNANIKTNVVYFDFQKAFDSVNHDIILQKLKQQFNIDGCLLRFFVNYLQNRYQRTVIGNEMSTNRLVNSGVPQGSIVGPTLFIIFLNDIIYDLSPGTNIVMYADDTKIWREISTQDDCWILQRDINQLLHWATTNKMVFHPSKSKVLSITNSNNSDNSFIYSIGARPIDYTDSEKDLGININGKLNWTEHCNAIYSKANQKLGLLKRTCSFVSNRTKRKALYLSQVRSQFEHCPIVWRPSSKTSVDRLESIQKRGIKWVINDIRESFSSVFNYYRICKELFILPISARFDLKDLTFFHAIFYDYSVISLPPYLKRFTVSRLRNSHFDSLSICTDVIPPTPQNLNSEQSSLGISKSYFYRAHLAWNHLPLELREIGSAGKFKVALTSHLWSELFESCNIDPD